MSQDSLAPQSIERSKLFSTPLFKKAFPKYPTYRSELIALIKNLESEQEGLSQSNQGGWHSNTHLHLLADKNPNIAWLTHRIQLVAQTSLSDLYQQDLTNALELDSCWAIINRQSDWNMPHNHLPSHWSGVFYLKTENDGSQGRLIFIDPSLQIPKASPTQIITPEEGCMYLFPSALVHMVEPNPTESERICIAFNLTIKD